jgi:hypothetical protein
MSQMQVNCISKSRNDRALQLMQELALFPNHFMRMQMFEFGAISSLTQM